MKKNLLALIVLVLFFQASFSQSPQFVPYQAVARNAAGNLLVNQAVSLRFTVHQTTATGTTQYEETQSATTNKLGLFNVNIGNGTPVSGTFAGITWSDGHPKFMQVEIDPAGGSSYTDMGATQMMSVPYALYAGSATSVPSSNLTESTSDVLSITGGSNSVVSAGGTAIQVKKATTSQDGYLSAADWTIFNNKQTTVALTTTGSSGAATFNSGTGALNVPNYTLAGLGGIGLTALSTSLPLSYNNTTGAFTISQANTSTNGYISSTDWNTFNNKISGTSTQYYVPHWTATSATTGTLSTTSLIYDNGTDVGIGTTGPSALLHLVTPNATGTSIQLRLAPTGGNTSNSTSVPSLIDFYSTFDAFPADQGPRRTASIKGEFSGGTWGTEALLFEVGTGAANDAGAEPTERMRITGAGVVKVAGLSGTGSRPVYADASGNLTTATSGSTSNRKVFSYTGSAQTWNSGSGFPAGVTTFYVKVWGAGGGSGYSTGDGPGGGGGFVSGVLNVPSGTTSLTIVVGQGGIGGPNSSASSGAAYGGGGAGWNYSGGGGGRSAIQVTAGTDVVTAGGGGGGAKSDYYYAGGGGGGLVGGAGGQGNFTNFGGGGTQTGGGILTGGGGCSGTSGTLYQGGTGCSSSYAGGGGGGYYGGAGAGNGGGNNGAGGGGSSYIAGLNPFFPIRNEQGATSSSQEGNQNYRPIAQTPGGTDGTDYSTTIGYGAGTVTSGSVGAAGGNGQVVIYW